MSKLYSTNSYDQILSTELPNLEQNYHLFKIICKYMIHGPCGDMKPDNVYMNGERNGEKGLLIVKTLIWYTEEEIMEEKW